MEKGEQETINQMLSKLSTQDKLELIAFLRALHEDESPEENHHETPKDLTEQPERKSIYSYTTATPSGGLFGD